MALTSMAALALAGSVAVADDIKVPSDPVAKAAFDVLDKSCARCHEVGRLVKRDKPAKNFGFVLDLDKLAGDPNYVLPGNPFGSRVYKQILDQEMPYDVMQEGSSNYSPTPEDMKALEAWIKSVGGSTVAACDPSKFISNADMIGYMAKDLDIQPRARVAGTRYLTLTNLKNACVSDADLNLYRMGAVKLINSLGRTSDVVKLETIDPDKTILRINIDDLGWDANDWNTLLAVYPYNVQPDINSTGIFRQATGTPLPYVRADWFAYYASRPPLYNALLKLGDTFQALAQNEGVDIDGDIKKVQVVRAGFQKSGVSENNRLIERHKSRSGYFWTSYDFGSSGGVKNLFEHPMGPRELAPPGTVGFEHDGGETIYSLPNGFQAYYLNNNKGVKLDTGPTNIVHDTSQKDLSVTNGISCMGCHALGMKPGPDDIRDLVLSGRTFSKDVRDTVEVMFPPRDKMKAILDADAKRFFDAEQRAGLDVKLAGTESNTEVINLLSRRYEADIDLKLGAADFGLTKEEYAKAAPDVDNKFKPLLRRLEQATVPFDQFEQSFRDLAVALTDQVVVDVGAGSGTLHLPSVAGNRAPDIALTSDKNSYRVGDTPVFTIISSKDCTLTLTDVDDKGVGVVLLPNKFMPDSRIKAGTPVTFPPPQNAPFLYRMNDPGNETIIAVCSDSENVDGIKHDFAHEAVTTIPNYAQTQTRSIAVVAACKRSIAVEGTAHAPGSCGSVTLPARPSAPPPVHGKPEPSAAALPKAVPESARASFRTAIVLPVH